MASALQELEYCLEFLEDRRQYCEKATGAAKGSHMRQHYLSMGSALFVASEVVKSALARANAHEVTS